MANPWEEIDLSKYEKHMRLDTVFQFQALNKLMKEQFRSYPVKSVVILGIAGGNGLEHIDKRNVSKVYGVDINKSYLDECVSRYPELSGIFEAVCADLTQENCVLPRADLIIADLVIEYIGYECFQKTVKQVAPKYVSAVIQINTEDGFVSVSPYIHIFDRLNEVHRQIEEAALTKAMKQIGYEKVLQAEENLPNGKKLVRMDFAI